jgi:Mrp family chromosome partitioning ATPase
MRAKLYDLQLKEQDLLSRYKETSEPVMEIRRQIAEAENLLKTEQKNLTTVTRGLSAAHQQVRSSLLSEQATLSALEAKSRVLQADLDRAREKLKELNDHEVNISQLERQMVVAESNFKKYSESREQARIDQALEMDRISNISIVQQPTFVATPVGPNRPLNLVIGILLGLFGAIGAAVGGELLDQSIRTPKDVNQQLGLDTIITIPQLAMPTIQRLATSAGAARKELPAGDMMEPTERAQTEGIVRSRINLYGESLRDGLLRVGNDGAAATARILAVTGCSGGEGVSTIAASIAGTLRAEGAGRILLIDTSAIHRSAEDDRFVLPTHAVQRIGDTHGNPLRPLAWKTGEDFLALLRREGSFVVLDCPPVLESATAARLCHLADSVILVVESERTRRHVAREASTRLRLANANVRGVVLNKKQFHLPTWLYERL